MDVDSFDQIRGSDIPQLSEARQKSFFDAVLARAVEAERRIGTIDQDIMLLGETVRLRFAGHALHDALMPALAHLAVPRVEKPGTLIHLWDGAESGIAMAPAPCPISCFTHRGDIWTMLSRRIRSAFHGGESSLSLLDLDGNEGVFWTRSAADLPYWSKAAPLRPMLNWWIVARGGHLLHAAAVATQDGGVLLTGKGGTGKSTTALNCLTAGFLYAGDDYVAVTGGDHPQAHSLYCTAKIDPGSMDRFAAFRPRCFRFGESEKAVSNLLPDWRNQIVRSLPIRAILTPELRDVPETVFEAAPRQKLVDAASFTTIAQLPHAGQDTIRFIENLVEDIPCFTIGLGSEQARIAKAIAAFLRESPAKHAFRPASIADDAKPLISVVIPVFNGAHFLADAVASIAAQDYAPLDIVIVDDGSVDDIDSAVATLPAEVRLLKQGHAGPSAARNQGIRNAAADYIAFLDVDDAWPAEKLKACLQALESRPDLDVVTGLSQNSKYDPETGEWAYVGDPSESFPYSIPAAVFRRRAFEKVGLFDERLSFGEDSDWFMRARDCGARIGRLDRPTLIVRRHGANMTFGRTNLEVTPARLLKKMLDRRRAQNP
jgi:hypothetical protein